MPIKMKNTIIVILILISCLGCKSQSLSDEGNPAVYAILNALGAQIEGKIKIYKKSFTSDEYDSQYLKTIEQKILITYVSKKNQEMAYTKIDSLKLLDKYTEIEIDSIGKILTKQYLQPSIHDFITKKDLEKMVITFTEKPIKWQKNKLTNIEITNDKGDMSLSVPVFSVDNSVATMFVKYPNSLTLEFFKKDENQNWNFYGSGLICRAD